MISYKKFFIEKRKKQYYSHCKKRAFERYNFNLLFSDYTKIRKKIKKRQCEFIFKSTFKNSIFKVDYENNNFIIIFDMKRKLIVTFLPKDYLIKK